MNSVCFGSLFLMYDNNALCTIQAFSAVFLNVGIALFFFLSFVLPTFRCRHVASHQPLTYINIYMGIFSSTCLD